MAQAEGWTRRRVKVYKCDESTGQWEDQGTGQLHCERSDSNDELILLVHSEKQGEPHILETPVFQDTAYQKQQDTLIVWTDPNGRGDMALSFQDPVGCAEIWERINRYQGKVVNEDDSDLPNHSQDELEHRQSGVAVVPMQLPEPEMRNLPAIAEMIGNVTQLDRESLVLALLQNDYIPRLLEVFGMLEDLEALESLNDMHKIFKTLVFLNDLNLYDTLFSEENILAVIGTFEYDPEMKLHSISHREFLTDKAKFKRVVEFRDKAVEGKVHQNFRLQYLKDVVLPRMLDDQTFTSINSMIMYNNNFIVSALHSDPEFFDDLFARLTDPATKTDAFGFLQELLQIAKTLQPNPRISFLTELFRRGVLNAIEANLADKSTKLRLALMDILTTLITCDANMVRAALMQQKDMMMMRTLVRRFIADPDSGIQEQIKELLRGLLDPELMEKDSFLQNFYEQCVDTLVQPLICPESEADVYSATLRGHLCDLLAFCVQHHGFRIKYYLLRKTVAQRVVELVHSKERFLVLAAIRFMRTFIGMNDDFYDKHVEKHNLLEPIVQVFLANGERYNLLNSAVLELFDYIQKEGRKVLVMYCVSKLRHLFENITYVGTFQKLILKYQQFTEETKDRASSVSSSAQPSHPLGVRGHDSDSDSEYFNKSDDEEGSGAAPLPNLVDASYGSDDDQDDDNAPPPLRTRMDSNAASSTVPPVVRTPPLRIGAIAPAGRPLSPPLSPTSSGSGSGGTGTGSPKPTGPHSPVRSPHGSPLAKASPMSALSVTEIGIMHGDAHNPVLQEQQHLTEQAAAAAAAASAGATGNNHSPKLGSMASPTSPAHFPLLSSAATASEGVSSPSHPAIIRSKRRSDELGAEGAAPPETSDSHETASTTTTATTTATTGEAAASAESNGLSGDSKRLKT